MEAKINVAEILKDKPKGTKLWSSVSNDECELQEITEDSIVVGMDDNGRIWTFSVYGTTFSFPKGGVLLFPSKEMRDWSKFSWKKGDVLQHSEYPLTVIFESFEDDTYSSFKCKYCFDFESASKWLVSNSQCSTKHFYKVSDKEAKEFIKKVELNYNGKLNLETLEIEPAQSEFKDGDIVAVDLDRKNIRIFKEKENENNFCWGKYYIGFSFNNEGKQIQTFKNYRADCRSDRLATDSEKQQLFDALAKEGKRWDAEKKQIVDIKKAPKFKPFEKVLVRDSYGDMWRACLFSHIREDDGRYATTGLTWKFCIPYIGNEHLLGTTKDVEG